MYRQVLDPLNGSLGWSAAVAVLPILTLFLLLGAVRTAAWKAAAGGLAVALLVAIGVYSVPTGQAFSAAAEGAAFGLFPLVWTFSTAIWIYAMTVESGHFRLLSRSFSQFSSDRRIQAVTIAFCFGALLEGIAGQGTPVAITSVMLLAVGFTPVRAVVIALVANTVPASFGPLGLPITTLAKVTDLPVDDLGDMVGRQVPVIAVLVPLVVVWMADGRRGLRETWGPALACGLAFGVTQFVTANYLAMPLADILAALAGAAVVVLTGRSRSPRPVDPAGGRPDSGTAQPFPVPAGPSSAGTAGDAAPAATGSATPGAAGAARAEATAGAVGAVSTVDPDRRAEDEGEPLTAAQAWPAYLPYVTIIAIFSLSQWDPVLDALNSATRIIDWPGLHLLSPSGKISTLPQYKLNLLSATGTMLLLAGLITMAALRISPARAGRTYLKTLYDLRWAILTVTAMLSMSFVMNASAQTATLGNWMAGAGGAFALLSPIVGWLGVAVTGSDTSSNSLFGSLQVSAAHKAALDPVLLASANASGGVVGKMISLQNLSIGAAAVGLTGQEGKLFGRMLLWSLALLALMCALVGLQSTPVLDWMVP
jgi:lactate permease